MNIKDAIHILSSQAEAEEDLSFWMFENNVIDKLNTKLVEAGLHRHVIPKGANFTASTQIFVNYTLYGGYGSYEDYIFRLPLTVVDDIDKGIDEAIQTLLEEERLVKDQKDKKLKEEEKARIEHRKKMYESLRKEFEY